MLELADNNINGFELNFISLHGTDGPALHVDRDAEGNQTHFGTVRRNLWPEERAMHAGTARSNCGATWAPRSSCSTSSSFSWRSPRTRRILWNPRPTPPPGCPSAADLSTAYVRGHKLMNDIQREFQPGGRLHAASGWKLALPQPEQ
ncbi:MAG: hypothetical protein IPI73_08210 [Betaproteobacteria bacterium]|nr:hypothetical protein [Betaproteobacteria bacterium]